MAQPEVQHRPRRGADVLSHLRTDEDEGGLGSGLGDGIKGRHCGLIRPPDCPGKRRSGCARDVAKPVKLR